MTTITILAASKNPGVVPSPMGTPDTLTAVIVTGLVLIGVFVILSFATGWKSVAEVAVGSFFIAAAVCFFTAFVTAATDGVEHADTWKAQTKAYLSTEYGVHLDDTDLRDLTHGDTVIVQYDGKPTAIKFTRQSGGKLGVLTTGDAPLESVNHL